MASPGFLFGPWNCRWSEAFYLTKHSIAMVNLKPILPGHCLVISRRVVPRFADLSDEEVADLWKTAKVLSKPLETKFDAESMTFAMQDGVAAGQTVPHVHIHVIPRKPGDFNRNDEIYDALDKSDASRGPAVDADEDRKPRTMDEMAEEAGMLRTLFSSPVPIPPLEE